MEIAAEAAGTNSTCCGQKVLTGLDVNNNLVIDATGEIIQTKFICDGADGTDGTNGTDGTDGTNGTDGYTTLVEITTEAAGTNCTSGGQTVLTGLDVNNNLVIDAPGEIIQTKDICDGADGTDGTNGTDGTDGTNGTDGYTTLVEITTEAVSYTNFRAH